MITKSIKRAWLDTTAALGGWVALIYLAPVPFVGFGLHWLVAGRDAMSAELMIWAIYGLAALGVVFVSLFLFNWVAAPYRITRDELNIANAKLVESQQRLARAEHLLETSPSQFPPIWLRHLFTEAQCQRIKLDESRVHFLYPWRMPHRPTIWWKSGFDGYKIDSWTNDGVTIIAQNAANDVMKLELTFSAQSKDENVALHRKIGKNGESLADVEKLVEIALRDPTKGYKYLQEIAGVTSQG